MTNYTDHVLLDRTAGGIAVITFNRPDARNALNLDAMRRFAAVIDALHRDEMLRVVVLTGAGETAFCSGGDLIELSSLKTAEEGGAMSALMGDALHALETLPVPVIGAINGYALGGGSEIALACDLRIVDASVRFGLVQVRWALTPGWGAGQRLLRLVGYAHAMELLLTGRILHAGELRELGLVNQVVDAGQALTHALELAQQIAAQSPAVVRAIKTLLQAGLNQPYTQALDTERAVFPPLWADEVHLTAVESFVNKRKRD